jgi:hypothetical protein
LAAPGHLLPDSLGDEAGEVGLVLHFRVVHNVSGCGSVG